MDFNNPEVRARKLLTKFSRIEKEFETGTSEDRRRRNEKMENERRGAMSKVFSSSETKLMRNGRSLEKKNGGSYEGEREGERGKLENF